MTQFAERTSVAEDTLTLEEAKMHLRVQFPDDDLIIEQLVKASLDYCERFCQRPLTFTAFTETLGPLEEFPEIIVIKSTDRPIQDSVEVSLGGTAVALDKVAFSNTGRCLTITVQTPVPDMGSESFITVTWTVDNESSSVRAARLLLVGNWYENREATAVGTIASQLEFGVHALLGVQTLP